MPLSTFNNIKVAKTIARNHTKLAKMLSNDTSIYYQCNNIIINNITFYHVNAILKMIISIFPLSKQPSFIFNPNIQF